LDGNTTLSSYCHGKAEVSVSKIADFSREQPQNSDNFILEGYGYGQYATNAF